MTKRPLVLYLDMSDISRFADLGTAREQPAVAETYAKLRHHLECGDVEVRFSCIHIAEMGKSGSKELAHRKARVIETLCGNLSTFSRDLEEGGVVTGPIIRGGVSFCHTQ